MSATFVWRAVLITLFLTSGLAAQSGPAVSTTTCYLDDGRQVYVRYIPVATNKERIQNGKPLIPGGTPMTLFSEAQLTFGTATIPIGAYTLYPIPGKKWSLAINRNVTAGASYDEKQDVAKEQIETDPVEQASDALEVAFAHVGARCTLRIYIGKIATFAEFSVK